MNDRKDERPSASHAAEVPIPRFLLIGCGGGGKVSVASAWRCHQAAGSPFVMHTLAMDTDRDGLEDFDSAINIAPTPDMVSAIRSNPNHYGPACQALIRQHPHLVETETLGHGARTHRIIPQASFEFFERRICEGFRSTIHGALGQGTSARVQPVAFATGGGGTGSAAAVLALDYFSDGPKKTEMMLGLSPDIVVKPVLFLIDPYAHAICQHNQVTPDWILANTYAMRTGLAEYEKAGKGYAIVFHLGLGNESGAVFPSVEQVCEVNGLLAWVWMRHYARFWARAADVFTFQWKTARFRGDVPEHYIPRELWPPYAGDGR